MFLQDFCFNGSHDCGGTILLKELSWVESSSIGGYSPAISYLPRETKGC